MCVLLDVEESETIDHHVVALLIGHSSAVVALLTNGNLHLTSFLEGARAILYGFGDQFSGLGDGEGFGHFLFLSVGGVSCFVGFIV